MLMSKLRVVFENASTSEVENWNQLGLAADRRPAARPPPPWRSGARRWSASSQATGELERSIAEVENQEARPADGQMTIDRAAPTSHGVARPPKVAPGARPRTHLLAR
jgi:hypothetical protein